MKEEISIEQLIADETENRLNMMEKEDYPFLKIFKSRLHMGSHWRWSEFTPRNFSDEWGDSIMSATMNDYIQQETITGVVPMTNGDRQYSFWDLFLSTSGFAIATWCYTQGAYVAQYLTFNQMLINIF